MPDFDVRQVDPVPHRKTIVALWQEYLPGTPESRFEWMARNPAGPTIWFMAFDARTGSVAGMLSVMRRRYYLGQRQIEAGIMGDFVVPKQYRAFGPGLGLPTAALARSRQAGIEMLYTMPNERSAKIVERAGFAWRQTLCLLSKPISSIQFTTPRTVHLFRALAPVVDAMLKVASIDFFIRPSGEVSEETCADHSFDALWESTKEDSRKVSGDHSAAYLNWRYFENPHHRFRLLTARRGDSVVGYSFFFVSDSRLELFELVTGDPKVVYSLLRKAADIARTERCKALYIRLAASDPLRGRLRRCFFLDVADDTSFLVSATDAALLANLHFCSGDRNL